MGGRDRTLEALLYSSVEKNVTEKCSQLEQRRVNIYHHAAAHAWMPKPVKD